MVSINAISLLLVLLSCTMTRGFVRNTPSPWNSRGASCKNHHDRLSAKNVLLKNSRVNRIPELWMAKGDVDTNPFYKGQDAYQILQVARGADIKVIKAGYRKAVSTWHPDKFPDDDKMKAEGNLRMEKINRAWYCLGDDDRKRRYDQYGEQGVGSSASSEEQIKAAGSPMGGSGFGGSSRGGGAVDVNDISDIFDSFFGGFSQGSQQTRKKTKNVNAPVAGEDMQVEVVIPFMTSLFGGSEKIKIRRLEECGPCTGNGIKPGSKVNTCNACRGQGVVNNVQRTPFGDFSDIVSCSNCRGSGQEIEDYCSTCKGKGNTFETKEVVLRIPAGVEAGVTLRVRDSGNAGKKGGPRGDLFVQVAVKNDPKFRREGMDIFTNEEISYYDAILGTTISADTVDGKMDVKIPSGTQPDQKIRIRGKGAPKLGSEVRGDAFLTVKVKIPSNIFGKEKVLIEQIAELSGKK